MSPSRTSRSETLDPSWSTPTTASLRGTINPVTRTRSEKQALVDFVTMTVALLGVSFSSGCARCSNQYQPPTKTAATTTPSAGLRYSESIIAGSVQYYRRCRSISCLVISDENVALGHSRHPEVRARRASENQRPGPSFLETAALRPSQDDGFEIRGEFRNKRRPALMRDAVAAAELHSAPPPFTWTRWSCSPCSRPGRGGSLPPSGCSGPSAWSCRIRRSRGQRREC